MSDKGKGGRPKGTTKVALAADRLLIVSDTSEQTGSYRAIQFITQGSLSAINGQKSPNLTFPAGFRLEGPIEGFALRNGSVVAYRE